RHLHGAAVEGRRTRPPQEREDLQRVFEEGVALRERREVPAVGPVLALEPGGADPAHGPTAGEDVEGGEDLAEVSDVPVGDAGDQGAQADGAGAAGQESERRVAV